jgi:hypothetical protein
MVIGNSAGNYHVMDVESNGGMVIPPEITSLWTRNPLEEFHRELTAMGRGIHPRNIFPPGIIRS